MATKTTMTHPAADTGSPAQRRLRDRFSVDTRALAVVRIGLAAIVIIEWLAGSLPDTGLGLVSIARWLTLPVAVLLLVGVHTRATAVLTWLAYGIPVRADLLTPGQSVHLGRYTLILVLFWAMFLPMGEHLSWDARHSGTRTPRFILSVASAGLLMQFFIMYFWAGMTKHMGEWVVERTALETVLSHPAHGSALGRAALGYPELLAIGSVATVLVEILGSLLLFLPHRGLATRRVVLVAAFLLFHVGMAMFMNLAFFPYVMMVSWLVFLPPKFWDGVFRRGRTAVPDSDWHRWRSLAAGIALAYVWVSSLVTWLYYPAREGLPAVIQEIGRHVLLYQQWAMFSVPSSL